MQKVTYYDDYSGQEIEGIMIRPMIQFAKEGAMPNEAEHELIQKLSPLTFTSIESMMKYFGEKYGKE